jgi:hypothetical protein
MKRSSLYNVSSRPEQLEQALTQALGDAIATGVKNTLSSGENALLVYTPRYDRCRCTGFYGTFCPNGDGSASGMSTTIGK